MNSVKEGTIGALDIPYILQDTIGRVASVQGCNWYLGEEHGKIMLILLSRLMMSLKMSGDTPDRFE